MKAYMPEKKGAHSYILDDERRKLAEENMRLVPYYIARRFGSRAANDEDVVSMGYVGLCQAAATYNPDAGIKFSTYAYKCIINRIHAYSHHKFTMAGGKGAHEYTTLNAPVPTDDDGDEEFIDFIPDPRHNTEREAISNIVMDYISPYIPTWKTIDEQGVSVTDYAKTQPVSKQRIHQRLQREFRRARSALIEAGYIEEPA